jgi:hypothetical protein
MLDCVTDTSPPGGQHSADMHLHALLGLLSRRSQLTSSTSAGDVRVPDNDVTRNSAHRKMSGMGASKKRRRRRQRHALRYDAV